MPLRADLAGLGPVSFGSGGAYGADRPGPGQALAGPWPPPMVAVIFPDATEITETEPVSPLPTHICEPSGVAAIEIGSRPPRPRRTPRSGRRR